MKSIIYKPTGRNNSIGQPEMEAVPLESTNGISLFNAVGDIAASGLGAKIAIDTLTYLFKQITHQKFYEVDVGEFLPVTAGEGAWNDTSRFNLVFENADDFESGNVNQGSQRARTAEVSVSIANKQFPNVIWEKSISYSLAEIQQALVSNNWDLIASLERARKKNYDLGIQDIAFLGSKANSSVLGLLSNTVITEDTSTITKYISSMTAAELNTFASTVIGLYQANSGSYELPNRFIIPRADYTGLGTMVTNTIGAMPYSKIQYLEDMFKRICGPDFKILSTAYADKTFNNGKRAYNKNVYLLYKHDPESVRLNLPVPYTTTQPATADGYTFTNKAYAQYSGVAVLRNRELYKMTF